MAKLSFGPDDEDAFHAARDQLLDEFESWLRERGSPDPDELVADAGLFVDWRWGYSSGEFNSYADADVAEFLVEWCPRKLSSPQEAATGICAAVAAFIEFMFTTDRLEGGAARAARLITLIDELTPAAFEAMGDESKFGMAKSIFGGLVQQAHSESPEELQTLLDQRMEEFNALPFDERRRLTDPHFARTTPKVVELPFVHVPPSADEIDRSARESPVIARFESLREYLGDSGRALTKKGNLRVADARELVELLDTGDEFDPEFAGHASTTRSSEQLPRLAFLLEWALQCRAVRRMKGRLVAVKVWGTAPVLRRAERAYVALIQLGPLWTFHRHSSWLDEIDELLDDGIPHWLSTMLPTNSERDFDELVEWASEATELRVAGRFSDWLTSDLDATVARRMALIFDLLVWAGVVEWTGRERIDERYGFSRWGHGVVRLTPLGHQVVPGHIAEAGYRLRSIPDLTTASAAELIDALTMTALDVDDVVAQWQPDVPAAERARMLVDAILVARSAGERLKGFAALRVVGPADAAPIVRQLLDSAVAGHAASFLLRDGLATDAEVGMFLDVGPMIDILATVVDEPEAMCELFSNAMREADALRDDRIDVATPAARDARRVGDPRPAPSRQASRQGRPQGRVPAPELDGESRRVSGVPTAESRHSGDCGDVGPGEVRAGAQDWFVPAGGERVYEAVAEVQTRRVATLPERSPRLDRAASGCLINSCHVDARLPEDLFEFEHTVRTQPRFGDDEHLDERRCTDQWNGILLECIRDHSCLWLREEQSHEC